MKDNHQATEPQKKAYEAPVVTREARVPLITAGSFDLLIPGR